jgi:hypothetical protein
MRAVVATGFGELELNFQWLPTWIGLNGRLKLELEKELAPHLEGRPLDDDTLDAAHDLVLTFLEARFPSFRGLRDYLDGLKFVDPQ